VRVGVGVVLASACVRGYGPVSVCVCLVCTCSSKERPACAPRVVKAHAACPPSFILPLVSATHALPLPFPCSPHLCRQRPISLRATGLCQGVDSKRSRHSLQGGGFSPPRCALQGIEVGQNRQNNRAYPRVCAHVYLHASIHERVHVGCI